MRSFSTDQSPILKIKFGMHPCRRSEIREQCVCALRALAPWWIRRQDAAAWSYFRRASSAVQPGWI